MLKLRSLSAIPRDIYRHIHKTATYIIDRSLNTSRTVHTRKFNQGEFDGEMGCNMRKFRELKKGSLWRPTLDCGNMQRQ